jgi:hypothetical protein
MSRTERRRGQTTIDFAIGASVFLIVVAFVISFVPGMFAPFEDPDRAQEADRVAATLATSALAHPDDPYALNVTCTQDFFDQMRGNGSADATCRFDTTTTAVGPTFGIDDVELNATVESVSTGAVVSDGGVTFAAGDPAPSTGSLAVARRTVDYDGDTYRLVVRAW